MAVYLAAVNHPGKLILETPFFSLQSLAQKIVPIFPSRFLLRFPLKSNEYIAQVTCPVYVFHGTNDEVVPYAQSERLFRLVTSSQREFYTIEGGGHNNLIMFEEFRKRITTVLD